MFPISSIRERNSIHSKFKISKFFVVTFFTAVLRSGMEAFMQSWTTEYQDLYTTLQSGEKDFDAALKQVEQLKHKLNSLTAEELVPI